MDSLISQAPTACGVASMVLGARELFFLTLRLAKFSRSSHLKRRARPTAAASFTQGHKTLIFSIKITSVVIFADGIWESWWQSRKTALAKKRVSFASFSQIAPSAWTLAVP
jgi:hypothetical protein